MNLIQITESNYKENNLESAVAIGIDLGTTNSLVSVVQDGKPIIIGEIVPSIVSFKGDIVNVGQYQKGWDNFSSIKKLMGKGKKDIDIFYGAMKYKFSPSSDDSIILHTDSGLFSPEEISSKILIHMKKIAEEYLGFPVTKAVITVPAYFDDGARNATKNAAILAGLEVIRLLNEPTAAALSYGLDSSSEGIYVIYDLGGGTFDLSILNMQKGVFQVLSTSGNNNFGGDNIDELLLDFILKKINFTKNLDTNSLNNLLIQARKIKEQLTFMEIVEEKLKIESEFYNFSINSVEFKKLISPSIEYTINLLKNLIAETNITEEEIKAIVLVGGATKMGLIKEKLIKEFSTNILDFDHPEKIVAKGAAIQAHALTKGASHLLLDVVPLSLGVEVMGGVFEVIIAKNTAIPISMEKEFTTYEDGQNAMIIHVLQGERSMASDCRSLAKFTLKNIPPMKSGMARVLITFTIDADGILKVKAFEKISKIEQKVDIDPSYGLDLEKMESILIDSYKNIQHDINLRKLAEIKLEALQFCLYLTNMVNKDHHLINQSELDKINLQIDFLKKYVHTTDNEEEIKGEIEKTKILCKNFLNKRSDFYLKNSTT